MPKLASVDLKTRAAQIEAAKIAKNTKFKALANKRVAAALSKIALIGNLSNRASYEYSSDDVTKIETVINDRTDEMLKRFKSALAGKHDGGNVPSLF